MHAKPIDNIVIPWRNQQAVQTHLSLARHLMAGYAIGTYPLAEGLEAPDPGRHCAPDSIYISETD